MTNDPGQHQTPQATQHATPPGAAPPDQAERTGFDPLDAVGLAVRGLAIGSADVVPGISGGTIALMTGIYERFIAALGSLTIAPLLLLLRGKPRQAQQSFLAMHWGVLIPLGLGMITAILAFSKFILTMMENHPGPTYALFFGLIVTSAWAPLTRMRTRTAQHAVAGVLAAVLAFLFVGAQPDGVSLREVRRDANPVAAIYASAIRSPNDVRTALAVIQTDRAPDGSLLPLVIFDRKGELLAGLPADIDADRLIVMQSKEDLEAWYTADATHQPVVVLAEQRASLLWIFICGVLAISAMVLPGISGSFLLLFLGQYHAVFSALHSVIDQIIAIVKQQPPDALATLSGTSLIGDLTFVAAFGMGVLLGLSLISRAVAWLLRHAHDITMAALTGLMIGALRVPGDAILEAVDAGASWGWIIITALGAAALVLALTVAERLLKPAKQHDNADAAAQ